MGDRACFSLEAGTHVHAKVFFITDGRCMSACLTFADLILSTESVIHVGQPTSADSVYIETRSERLPSGIGRLGFSMNIRSKGLRGNNQPYIPAFVWDQDISDTKALEGWIQTPDK